MYKNVHIFAHQKHKHTTILNRISSHLHLYFFLDCCYIFSLFIIKNEEKERKLVNLLFLLFNSFFLHDDSHTELDIIRSQISISI